MTSTVRSVRVVMDAEISAYVAKMRTAGRETDAAFDKVEKRLGGTNREMGELDKSSSAVSKSMADARTQARGLDQDVDKLGRTSNRTGSSIDKYSGRLSALVDIALVGAPALISLGGAAIPLVTASLAGLGAAAGGIGVTVLAFQGIGDAVKALAAYDLQPTVANLQKVHKAMMQLGPDGQEFAQFVADLYPQLKQLQGIAQAGVFPGLEAGITDLLTRLPLVEEVVSELAHGMGDLAAEAGHALSSEEFTPFFTYLKTDAEPTLKAFAEATGNVIETVANLFVAFAPLNRSFTAGLVEDTQALANWSEKLDSNNSFQGLLDYIRQNGPEAIALIGSLVTTFGSIVEAGAPIGHELLPVLTDVSNIIGVIARSDIGTPLLGGIIALRLYGRAAQGIALAKTEMIGLGFASKTTGVSLESTATGLRRLSTTPVGILAVAGAVTVLGNALADALGATIKTDDLQRNLVALAGGNDAGGLLSRLNNDFATTAQTSGKIIEPLHEAATAFGLFGNTSMDNAADNIHQVDEALAQMVESGNADQAAKAFQQIEASVLGGFPGASHSKADVDGLMKSFGAYRTALSNVKPAAGDAAGALEGYTSAAIASAAANREQVKDINRANQALRDQADAALSAFDAETQYRQALKEANAQADKNNAGIKGNSDAALKNRDDLSALAAAWNGQSKAVQNNVDKFRSARQSFIDTAEAMGVPKKAAQDLADTLLHIPRSTVAKVTAETAAAQAAIARVGTDLRNLHDRDLYIRVHTVGGSIGSHGDPGLPDAHGGTGQARGGLAGHGRPIMRPFPRSARRYARGGVVGDHDDPLFTGEGPRYYKAAYKHNRPFAVAPKDPSWPYQTPLTNALNTMFEKWVNDYQIPFNMRAKLVDYDMRGFYKKAHPRSWTEGQHFPDTWKTPYDTTFSHESKYATKDNPFYWRGDRLIDIRTGQIVYAPPPGGEQRAVKKADGGSVYGPGGPTDDLIPAWLSNREFVMPVDAVDYYGLDTMEAMRTRRLAAGGYVGPYARAGAGGTPTGNNVAFSTPLFELGGAAQQAAHGLKALKEQSAALQKEQDKAKAKRDALQSRYDSITSSVTSGLTSDLFTPSSAVGDPFAAGSTPAGTVDPIAVLQGDIANATLFHQLEKELKKRGLTGDALDYAASTGGLAGLQNLAGDSDSQLALFQQLYGQRAHDVAVAATGTAQDVVGQQLTSANDYLSKINHRLHSVEQAIKQADKANQKKHDKTAHAAATSGTAAAATARRRAR